MHIDLGSGDGKGPYRWAMRRSQWMYLATDLNAAGLSETAKRAARKPARGGIGNLLCVAEPLEVLAAELPELAHHVTAILPWGSLLRALVRPEPEYLAQLRTLCAPGATFELVVSYEPGRDFDEFHRLGVPEPDTAFLTEVLAKSYESSGFILIHCKTLIPERLASYETTWAKRLAFGSSRPSWSLEMRRQPRRFPFPQASV